MKLIGFGCIFLLLGACQTLSDYSLADASSDEPVLTEGRRVFLQSELQTQRDIWAKNTPKKYSFHISQSCFCFFGPDRGPNEVQVENGQVVRRIYRGNSKYDFATDGEIEGELGLDKSIDDMFELVEKLLEPDSRNPWLNGKDVIINLTIEYDENRGFPTSIDYDVMPILDDQFTLVIQKFKVIE